MKYALSWQQNTYSTYRFDVSTEQGNVSEQRDLIGKVMYREKLDLVPGTDIVGLKDGNTIVHLGEIKHNKEFLFNP